MKNRSCIFCQFKFILIGPKEICKEQHLIFISEIMNGLITNPAEDYFTLAHQATRISTRHDTPLHVRTLRLSVSQLTFLYKAPTLCKHLPRSIRDVQTLTAFKFAKWSLLLSDVHIIHCDTIE